MSKYLKLCVTVLLSALVCACGTPATDMIDNISEAVTDCSVPIALNPISDMRVHQGFPVNYRASVNRWCGSLNFSTVSAPPEFSLDGSGGLFYWTPSTLGPVAITIQAREYYNGQYSYAQTTFNAYVDSNTIVNPLFRDYLSGPDSFTVNGRAMGDLNYSFVSYTLDYAIIADERITNPSIWTTKLGPIYTPVASVSQLALFDISDHTVFPDGTRMMIRLTVNLRDSVGNQVASQVQDRIIIDRSAKPGWPKRIEPMTHSPILADLDDDGKKEVLAFTHSGKLYVWKIDGTLLWSKTGLGTGYNAPSVGDIDGDGKPDIVVASTTKLYAYHSDGSSIIGFPITVEFDHEFRAVPTLADLNGDGVLDIVIPERGQTSTSVARIYVYTYMNSLASVLSGWPQAMDNFDIYSSASVAEVDAVSGPDVIVAGRYKVFAWHSDGSIIPGLHQTILSAPIINTQVNGSGSFGASAQPALVDLDNNGTVFIVIGSNVLSPTGQYKSGWTAIKPGAINSLPSSVGELDGNLQNGLEVVSGTHMWHADGSQFNNSLPIYIGSSVLGDCGTGDVDIMAGTRSNLISPGIVDFDTSGAVNPMYPKSLYGETGDSAAPVVGDFDNDGYTDVAVAITDSSYGGVIAIYGKNGPNHDENHYWPMLGHDVRHSGRYAPPQPNQPTQLNKSVSGSGTVLTWTDNSNVESGYVIERSSSGAPFTYSMVAEIPANSISYIDSQTGFYYRVKAKRIDPASRLPILSSASNVIYSVLNIPPPCVAGGNCTSANPCHVAIISCSTGTAVCTDSGNIANGTSCGTNLVCNNGACISCGVACTSNNLCHTATISCSTAICTDTGNVANGTSCGMNMACNSGNCISCTAGSVCTSSNPCHTAAISCLTGSPICADTGNLIDGTVCGTSKICSGGNCTLCAAGIVCTCL